MAEGVLRAGGIEVRYTRKDVKNFNLRIKADGTVSMSVPRRAPLAAAQRFLDDREEWLLSHVARARERDESRRREPDGRIALWGRLVDLEPGTTEPELWRRELGARLPEVVERMEAATGLSARGWQLRDMSTRWGSCTPATGRIRINIRLAAYPPACLDYVVAHELTHLAEPSHNARFHRLLARAFADEGAARALLRRDAREVAQGL